MKTLEQRILKDGRVLNQDEKNQIHFC